MTPRPPRSGSHLRTALRCLVAGVTLHLAQSTLAASPAELTRQAYASSETGERREYFVYLPEGYRDDPARRWPVMLFLHGGGERGDGLRDLDWVLVHGPLHEAWIQRRPLPFIIVSPQLPVFGHTEQIDRVDADKPRTDLAAPPPRLPHHRAAAFERRQHSPIDRGAAADFPPGFYQQWEPFPAAGQPADGWIRIETDLIAMLDAVMQSFQTDPDRVYLTGLSYGGFGTFDLAARHADRFAAIAPVVGSGHLEDVPALVRARIPIWLFGSGVDPVVKPHWLYRMARELELAGHPDLQFTVHEDMSHDAWKRVYGGEDLYQWLLSKRRSNRP